MIIQKSIHQENIVQLLIKLENADSDLKEKIQAEIIRRELSEQEMQRAQKEYMNFRNYIKKEESKPLPWYMKLSCLIVPFSASKLYNSEDLPERELERLSTTHNTRQKKEILKYSTIGLIILATVLIISMSYSIVQRLLN